MGIVDSHILLMKVGFHGDEPLDKIITRKNEEVAKIGHTYWGYGGTLCHPTRVVQPFAHEHSGGSEKDIRVLFSVTPSAFHSSNTAPATHFSEDGVSWKKLPEETLITASRFALVLKKIQPIDTQLDMSRYAVGFGPSYGRPLQDYLRFRVDKAVAFRDDQKPAIQSTIKIGFMATLAPPFAIWVRRESDSALLQNISPLQ